MTNPLIIHINDLRNKKEVRRALANSRTEQLESLGFHLFKETVDGVLFYRHESIECINTEHNTKLLIISHKSNKWSCYLSTADFRKALRLHKKTSFDKCINTTIKTIKAITSKGESQ